MSLSNPRAQSPVRKYFKVRSSTGHLVWYDKSSSKEIEVEVPFKFITLDVLNTIGGFNEPSSSGIYSNEVRTNKDVLTVRTKGGVLAQGPYDVIKDRLKAEGGKFGNSVYIAYREDRELTLGNITFIGAAVSEWFDFKKGRHLDSEPGVSITGWEHRTKGRNEFYVPTFQGLTVTPEDLAAAQSLDETLQAHLNGSSSEEVQVEPEPAFAHSGPTQTSFADYADEPPF